MIKKRAAKAGDTKAVTLRVNLALPIAEVVPPLTERAYAQKTEMILVLQHKEAKARYPTEQE